MLWKLNKKRRYVYDSIYGCLHLGRYPKSEMRWDDTHTIFLNPLNSIDVAFVAGEKARIEDIRCNTGKSFIKTMNAVTKLARDKGYKWLSFADNNHILFEEQRRWLTEYGFFCERVFNAAELYEYQIPDRIV